MHGNFTSRLVAQAARVAELLDEGFTNKRIGEAMGVSAPRVAQIRALLPELASYLGRPVPLDRLRSHREQLWLLRHHALDLAAVIRRDLRELEEELEAAEFDRILGLRAG